MTVNREIVTVGGALDLPGYPISPAVRIGDRVETAGVIPIDPRSGELLTAGIAEQAALCIDNLERILRAAGSGLDQMAFVDVVLADPGRDFEGFNTVYRSRIPEPFPARRTIGGHLALPGLLIEMRATAACEG